MLRALGRHPDCQALQVEQSGRYMDQAKALCREYDLWSERGLALMFDIAVQNGSISPAVKKQVAADLDVIAKRGTLREEDRMRSIAHRRAAAAKPRFVEDVRRRKLAIAEGRGTVHGIDYDLERDFGLTLKPFR
jgi:hypothetical protein